MLTTHTFTCFSVATASFSFLEGPLDTGSYPEGEGYCIDVTIYMDVSVFNLFMVLCNILNESVNIDHSMLDIHRSCIINCRNN